MNDLSVIVGKSSIELGTKLARKCKANLVKSEIRVFPDGENKITLKGKISSKKIIVIQSAYPPVDTNLIQALSLVSKAKEFAKEVILVIPYMGYARQDREFLPGEITTMKVLGQLTKGVGTSKIIVVDIHSKIGLKHFRIKSQNVTAIPELVKYLKKLRLKDPLIVSPDHGGKDRAKLFAQEFGTEFLALEKKRDRKTGRVEIISKSVNVKNRDLILVDDMISTGGSIVHAAEFLKKQNARQIFVACTHALLLNNAEIKIKKSGVKQIISTNSIPGKTSKVDISNIIFRAIVNA